MLLNNDDKPQITKLKGKYTELEDDASKNKHQSLENETFTEGNTHSRMQRQKGQLNGDNAKVFNSNEEEWRLAENCSNKEESLLDMSCQIKENGFAETPNVNVDIVKFDGCSVKEKQESHMKSDGEALIDGSVADVAHGNDEALKGKKNDSAEYGHAAIHHNEENKKEYTKSVTVNGNAADIPCRDVDVFKAKQNKCKKNCNNGMKRREKVEDSSATEDPILSSNQKKMSPVPEKPNAKSIHPAKKNQKPLPKKKGQESCKNKKTTDTNNYKDGNATNVSLSSDVHAKKVTDKSKVSEKCAASISISNEKENLRITKTRGQIELFNTKDVQQGDLDKSTVYVANLPKDVDVCEVQAVFEKVGTVESIRLMMNPNKGDSQGYGFVTFIKAEDAQKALQSLSGYEIRQKRFIAVNHAQENKRLFVGNLLKNMSKDDMLREFSTMTHGLVDVIIYKGMSGERNRGFCFLEYESHRAACKAKITLEKAIKYKLPLMIDWADTTVEPTDEVMATVKRVYLANLSPKTSEDFILEHFERFGTVERVKKIKNYAFVHFKERRCAIQAIKKMDGVEFDGEIIKAMLSKPPLKKYVRENILRKREQRMTRYLPQSWHPQTRRSVFPPKALYSHNQQKASPTSLKYCRRFSPSSDEHGHFNAQGMVSPHNLPSNSANPIVLQYRRRFSPSFQEHGHSHSHDMFPPHHLPDNSGSPKFMQYHRCFSPSLEEHGRSYAHDMYHPSTYWPSLGGSSASTHSSPESPRPRHPDLRHTLRGLPINCPLSAYKSAMCPKGNEPFHCCSFH